MAVFYSKFSYVYCICILESNLKISMERKKIQNEPKGLKIEHLIICNHFFSIFFERYFLSK